MEIDRISGLPDDLLCRILSFLPTKQAFTTTFLSKRWTRVFKSLTSLRFNDKSVRNKDTYIRFCQLVETVTISTQRIQKFHLECRSVYWENNCFKIDGWIETVKEHPVEELRLFGTFDNRITLQPNIFKFSTLVVLSLMSAKVVGKISVDLPSLQTLQLDSVCFENKENFQKVVSGCPILRELRTEVYYIKKEQDEDVRLSTEWFKSLSNLNKADIHIDRFDVPFRAISNVKILTLRVKNKLPEINSYNGGFPVFQNLINLNLFFFNFHHWNDVMEVLQYCPKLQILSILKFPGNLSFNWKYPSSVPECISSHLISCTMNYQGWEGEIDFIKYILKNAQLLEVMNIDNSHYSPYSRLYQDLSEELTSCPTISAKCKVSIDQFVKYEIDFDSS